MYSRVETQLQMKTTTLVDISIKSNSNEQTSCQRSGRAPPFLLLRLSRTVAIRATCEISRALGLLELSWMPALSVPVLNSLMGAPGATVHLPVLVMTRFYSLKTMAADLLTSHP